MKLIRNRSERPRREHDFYPTPYGLAHAALTRLASDKELGIQYPNVLDAGCGYGVWMDATKDIFPHALVHGIDIEPHVVGAYRGDFLAHNAATLGQGLFDMIIGNPPYSDMEAFVRHSLEDSLLATGGLVLFLCRLEFLASKTRCYGLYTEHPPLQVWVSSRRPSFFSTNGRRTTDAQDYAMFLWQKGHRGKTELSWLYWDYEEKRDQITEIDHAPTAPAVDASSWRGGYYQATFWGENGQD